VSAQSFQDKVLKISKTVAPEACTLKGIEALRILACELANSSQTYLPVKGMW